MTGSHAAPDPRPDRPDEEGRTLPVVPGPGLSPGSPCEDTASFHGDVPPQSSAGAAGPSEHPVPADLVNHPRYRILEYLGSGGMGTVYKARHLFMDRVVALKIINVELMNRPAMVERFRREVRAAAQLAHPNIVAAYDADQAGITHFLVMEFVEGVDLDQVLRQRGRLPFAEACDYARQTALGLQHAWERGMVHRDVKPHNLMRTASGQIKILDFGLARFLSEVATDDSFLPEPAPAAAIHAPAAEATDATDPDTPTRLVKGTSYTYTGAGTADYIAPEEAVNPRHADIRADIYSLGCTLYRFLSGQVPFPGGNLLVKVQAHLEQAPESLAALVPDLPARLVPVVERMMAKDPARRYQTPAEVAEALAPFAAATPHPILIVEDDPATRTSMALVFEARGYPVAVAANGQEALDLLRQGIRPCLILLDLMMPVMTGSEFLQQQKQDSSLAGIPVIIISAADANHARAMALGAADYLQKPIEIAELTAKVQDYAAPQQ